MEVADAAVVFDLAGEAAVVQTRFATVEWALWRAPFGEGLGGVPVEAARALAGPLPEGVRRSRWSAAGNRLYRWPVGRLRPFWP
jgi:hypothetical protein